jgi:hypothetical protein
MSWYRASTSIPTKSKPWRLPAPGVAECACVGVPDEKTGEAVRLFVVKATDASLTDDQIVAHCKLDLASYKVPKQVRFLDTLPKSTVGKILRKDLRAIAYGVGHGGHGFYDDQVPQFAGCEMGTSGSGAAGQIRRQSVWHQNTRPHESSSADPRDPELSDREKC